MRQQGWVALGFAIVGTAAGSDSAPSSFGVPGPMVLSAGGGEHLATTLQRRGEIRVFDTATSETVRALSLDGKIAGLISFPSSDQLLAAVETPDELVLLSRMPDIEVLSRYSLDESPGHLAISDIGKEIAVSNPGSRSVQIFDMGGAEPVQVRRIELNFTPGRLLFLPQAVSLLIADAFGGRFAVVGLRGPTDVVPFETPFHNISGLTLTPDGRRILIAHQKASSLARSSFDDVHWGSLMRNEITSIPADVFFEDPADIRTLAVGDVNEAAGDPSGIVTDNAGRIFIALAGIDAVGVFKPGKSGMDRIAVGRRPRELLLDEARRRLYVANSLEDTISVIDTGTRKVVAEFNARSGNEPNAADRGERLFFDARLSHDGWMSCHSCHTNGHSNGRLIDTLGDGAHGSPKRVLSLLGVRDTAPYAWNGSMPDLKSQISKTMESTMHRGEELTEEQTNELAVFLESLDPPEKPRVEVDQKADSIGRGRELFAGDLRCNRCHDPESTYTSAEVYDVGLKDEAGNTEFNPPSLLGVGQRSLYFHDGRAESLEQVFSEHRHQLEERELTEEETRDLLAFLRSQ